MHCLVASPSWDIGQYVHCNCLLTRLCRHKFWNLSYFFNQSVVSTWPKSQDKNLNILRTKKGFKIKWKTYFIIFKEQHYIIFIIKANKTIFFVGDSPTLSHYCARFDGCLSCGKDDVMFIFWHVILHCHMFKGTCDLISGNPTI